MGLMGAPGSFHHLRDSVLRGLPFVTMYLDDLLIYKSIKNTYVKFFDIFKIPAKPYVEKMHIGLPQVYYLGYIFDGNNMHPDSCLLLSTLSNISIYWKYKAWCTMSTSSRETITTSTM